MQSSISGNIFYFDARRDTRAAFVDIFANKALQTFASDNIYQFLRYAKELLPNVMILNLSDSDEQTAAALKNFETQAAATHFPIIVIKARNEAFTVNPRIAHYLSMPEDYRRLTDIIESYSYGHQKHQLMLLDRYSPHSDKLHEWLAARNISYFEVHNPDAAAVYLQKNHPAAVWIEYVPEFIAARHTLLHQRIFYVDRHQDTAEIQKFLA
jgi:PleD family two-component response regulator